jgi:hypothetical protein
MKRRKSKRKIFNTLSFPAIREFREAVENGKIGGWLIKAGEDACAGSVKIKYKIKDRPWVVSVEARRIYKKCR